MVHEDAKQREDAMEMKNEKATKEWKSITENQEKRIQHLQCTAFQLANYYLVFQGILIITAISNGTSAFRCGYRWFLITLSAIQVLLNLVSLLITGIEFKRSLGHHDLNWSCYIHQFHVEKKTRESQASTMLLLKPDPFTNCLRHVCLLLFMLLFFAFTVVTFTGCAIILCRPVTMG